MLIGLACTSQTPSAPQEPRLLHEETLPPPTATPLLLISPTFTPVPIQLEPGQLPSATPKQTQVGFRLRTATPPDSPTPSITPSLTATLRPSLTVTITPSRTTTPTITSTFTARPPATDTPELIVLQVTPTGTISQANAACSIAWFFSPAPATCPLTPPTSGLAAYQAMQNGMLIWVQNGEVIFALFSDGAFPAWLFTPDRYQEGESLPILTAPDGLLQPQRGFGKFWIEDTASQGRLGWAIAGESPYNAFIQSDATTGTRYLSGPTGEIFALFQDQRRWERIR